MFGKRRFLINAQGKSCLLFQDRRRKVVEGLPSAQKPPVDLPMIEMAIHEEGWVAVEVDGDSGETEISLDVSKIAPNALIGAGNMLISQPTGPVRLRCFGADWTETVFKAGSEAAAGLLQAVSAGMDDVGRQRFTTNHVDFSSLEADQKDACVSLFNLFEFWRDRAFAFDTSVLDFLRAQGLFERSTLVEPDSGTLGGVFLFTGPGFKLYGSDWPQHSMGLPVTEQPDPIYGRWVGQTYERLFRSNAPEMVQVDATIMSYPLHAPRRSYICARLPWTAGEQRLILSASVLLN